ncbi:MAG: metallophosphoesterase [Lachnospiraceae bacterium]
MEELWIVIGVIGILLIALFCYCRTTLFHTRIKIKTNKLKNGLRIVHLSDLHSKIFSRNRLFREVKRENPDFIFFTGDVADRYKSDEKAFDAVNELSKLIEIAPVIAVSGNHEYGRLNREELFSYMEKRGIKLLRKEVTA